jgi:hypothetical protein
MRFVPDIYVRLFRAIRLEIAAVIDRPSKIDVFRTPTPDNDLLKSRDREIEQLKKQLLIAYSAGKHGALRAVALKTNRLINVIEAKLNEKGLKGFEANQAASEIAQAINDVVNLYNPETGFHEDKKG